MQKKRLTILLIVLINSMVFPIMVRDYLSRGKYYQLRFRIKPGKDYKRYVGLYTEKSLNSDLLIFDSNKKLIVKVSGTSGKYPKGISFPGSGIYTARVMAYSGSGPFLMLISNRGELKTILKDVR